MSFAENLKDVLDFRDMQVKELSAKTGISKNTLDNYLSGQKSLPNIENGVKIAQALGVTAEYLVTRNARSVMLPATTGAAAQKHDCKSLADAISTLDAIDRASVSALITAMQRRYQ